MPVTDDEFYEISKVYFDVRQELVENESDPEAREYWQGKKDGIRMVLALIAPDADTRRRWEQLQESAANSRETRTQALDGQLAAVTKERDELRELADDLHDCLREWPLSHPRRPQAMKASNAYWHYVDRVESAALAGADTLGGGAGIGAPQPVLGGAPVRYEAGLDDAAYLEMLSEQRHEANYRAAHGLSPDAGPRGADTLRAGGAGIDAPPG